MSLIRFVSKGLLAALLLTACSLSGDDDSPVVASVYGRELHDCDLEGIVPAGFSGEDSVAVVENYVEQWIRQAVILAKAEKNVKNDFSRELQEYKNSLLAYAYERQILDQLLDTAVTNVQIIDYYRSHKQDFPLKGSIVKAVYASVPLHSPAVGRLKNIVSREPFSDHDALEFQQTLARNNLQGHSDANSWIPFVTLQTTIPVTAYNEQLFLRQHRTISFKDDSLCYVARILAYRVTDEISPLELQRDNIRAIILNHRKIDILNKLHADLLKEAEDGGHVKRIKN